MTESFEYNAPALDRWQVPSLLIGLIALAASILGYFVYKGDNHQAAFQAYLIAFIFWWCITIGLFGLLMLQHMVGGPWGLLARRVFESGARLMPLMLVFFLPIAFGMLSSHGDFYSWTLEHGQVAHNNSWLNSVWLTPHGWIIRAAIYFAIWFIMIFFLLRWSDAQDRSADPGWKRKMRTLSGPGLVIFAFTSTAAV
ncbi:MAG TPA: hypothetical protein VG722_11020, partial [Tepidisphaeraceae bacterium]|nr:hypothetical protein [Tepidisphaeraceae bacterium]